MIYKEPKLVIVYWRDSQSGDDWEEIKEPGKLPVVETVGMLIASNDECISVTGNFDPTNQEISCRMDIPRFAIANIFELNQTGPLDLESL